METRPVLPPFLVRMLNVLKLILFIIQMLFSEVKKKCQPCLDKQKVN